MEHSIDENRCTIKCAKKTWNQLFIFFLLFDSSELVGVRASSVVTKRENAEKFIHPAHCTRLLPWIIWKMKYEKHDVYWQRPRFMSMIGWLAQNELRRSSVRQMYKHSTRYCKIWEILEYSIVEWALFRFQQPPESSEFEFSEMVNEHWAYWRQWAKLLHPIHIINFMNNHTREYEVSLSVNRQFNWHQLIEKLSKYVSNRLCTGTIQRPRRFGHLIVRKTAKFRIEQPNDYFGWYKWNFNWIFNPTFNDKMILPLSAIAINKLFQILFPLNAWQIPNKYCFFPNNFIFYTVYTQNWNIMQRIVCN